MWSVIKRWLDPVTQEKISILGGSYQAALLQQIPAENLPSRFGGSCQCSGGCELSDEGPWQDPKWLAPTQTISASKSVEPAAPPAYDPETGGGLSDIKGENEDVVHAG